MCIWYSGERAPYLRLPSPGEPFLVLCISCALLLLRWIENGNPEGHLNTWHFLHLKRLISPHSCLCSSNCFRNVVLSQAVLEKTCLELRLQSSLVLRRDRASCFHMNSGLTHRHGARAPVGTKSNVSVGAQTKGASKQQVEIR